ncbi:MAG: hypothetical protein GXP13_02855 [Gammaproteobacteria bacterium]|nr:hypothetical protein [Gammaproteobacteria bacterium]
MAKVDEDLDLDVEGKQDKKGSGKMKMIIILSLVGILVIGLSITVTLLLLGGDKPAPVAAAGTAAPAPAPHAQDDGHGDEHGGEAPPVEAIKDSSKVAYMALNPAFVVNLEGGESGIRYLQLTLSVMVAKESNLEIVKKHMPVLRHNLNLLFGSLDFDDIRSREGKEKLTSESLKVIRNALQSSTGKPIVQAVFFNSIVGQ